MFGQFEQNTVFEKTYSALKNIIMHGNQLMSWKNQSFFLKNEVRWYYKVPCTLSEEDEDPI